MTFQIRLPLAGEKAVSIPVNGANHAEVDEHGRLYLWTSAGEDRELVGIFQPDAWINATRDGAIPKV